MNPLVAMQKLGQSPWHDNIRRSLITSGKLKKMIEDGDITGLTSNPTIFEQAIGQSSDYDQALATLARAGKSHGEIFEALAVEDIRNAADLFRPVYERTKAVDGYVSIEVSPTLASDTQATFEEAKRLWAAVDRPNLMVKIPATLAGIPAIQKSLAQGININVTLIFSLDRYRAVMDAFVAGISERLNAKKDVSRLASVASFFVSRVDTAVDKLLEQKKQPGADALLGKAAIANAKMAYQAFLQRFSQPDFAALKKAGAQVQRPLWASTSSKNPKYPDVYYVEALLGSDTVDTMPPATIDAYRDHGKPEVRITQGVDEAKAQLGQLQKLGIDLNAVTHQLEVEGVAAFAKSFESLLQTVESRRKAVLGK